MRSVYSLLLVLALMIPGAALAADDSKSAPAGTVELAWEMSFKHPGAEMTIFVPYPQGFGQEADAALGAFAKKSFDEAFEPFRSFIAERAEEVRAATSTGGKLPDDAMRGPWFSKYAYVVETPSPTYASVVFYKEEYTGGAHGNKATTVLSFNRESGKTLTLDDVFADKEKSVAALLPLITKGVQALKAKDAEPVKGDAQTLDVKMERMALTPAGIRVFYDPYELGSYVEGAFVTDIAKEELIKLGANPAIWGAQ